MRDGSRFMGARDPVVFLIASARPNPVFLAHRPPPPHHRYRLLISTEGGKTMDRPSRELFLTGCLPLPAQWRLAALQPATQGPLPRLGPPTMQVP